jgi:5-methylcytosine-specific restriction protein A
MMTKAIASRNPRWTQDELVLALELFFKLDSPSAFSPSRTEVLALSDDLNRLRSVEAADEKFRNANGVSMKLHNFSRFRDRQAKGLSHGGKLEEEIWAKYSISQSALREAAQMIRSRLEREQT